MNGGARHAISQSWRSSLHCCASELHLRIGIECGYELKIIIVGNGNFTYFPAIPEYITRKKGKRDVCIDIRPFLRRRNIRFVDGVVTEASIR